MFCYESRRANSLYIFNSLNKYVNRSNSLIRIQLASLLLNSNKTIALSLGVKAEPTNCKCNISGCIGNYIISGFKRCLMIILHRQCHSGLDIINIIILISTATMVVL